MLAGSGTFVGAVHAGLYNGLPLAKLEMSLVYVRR